MAASRSCSLVAMRVPGSSPDETRSLSTPLPAALAVTTGRGDGQPLIRDTMHRRHLLMLTLVPAAPAIAWALPAAAPSQSAMLAFDGLYIPVLFMTGSAGKSEEAAAKASAAMRRLREQWPALRQALAAAVPAQPTWVQALATVKTQLDEANELVSKARWDAAHEALEHVRETLFAARRGLGIDYALDEFTAYHTAMEKLANATAVRRPAFEVDFAAARALWRRIEIMSFDPTTYGLTPTRSNQLAQARTDETAALSRLSMALREASDADLLKAAAAIKPPFVRAYLAFGSAP
ncbi:MAG: hypothetical protein ABI574_11665 [Burkholderiales bacterium]